MSVKEMILDSKHECMSRGRDGSTSGRETC